MPRRRTRATAATLTAVVLVLTGCSRENDGEPEQPTAAPAVADLDLIWETATDDRPFHDIDEGRGDAMWPAGDVLGVVGKQSVTTYDVANGDATARIDLPDPVCAVSPDVNREGVGAVLTGALDEDGVHVAQCDTAVAIDTVAGRILWSRRVAEVAYVNNISVGAETVAVSDIAAGARRLRVDDGAPLPTLGTSYSSGNGSLVVATSGEDDAVLVYDQDSGKELRRLPIGGVNDVGVVLPGEPTLVAVDDRSSDFHLRDVSGRRARIVGQELQRSYPQLWRSVQVDGSTVLQYGGSPVVDRWDPDTRTLVNVITLDPTESLIGVHDGRLVTAAPFGNHLAPTSLVRAIDPADPTDPLVLGTFDRSAGAVLGIAGAVEVIGDLVIGQSDAGLVALRLPSDGIATSELSPVPPGS